MVLARAAFVAFSLTMAAVSAPPAWGAGTSPTSLHSFQITTEPARADWRFFIRAPEAGREQLWTYHTAAGRRLGDWSWGWRMGWLRTCARSTRVYCADVMKQGLNDKALVVRAEAATRLGQRFEGSLDQGAVTMLRDAYQNKRNLRHGRPLFVQQRILFALRQIGGDAAKSTGRALAESDTGLRHYWARLEHAEGG